MSVFEKKQTAVRIANQSNTGNGDLREIEFLPDSYSSSLHSPQQFNPYGNPYLQVNDTAENRDDHGDNFESEVTGEVARVDSQMYNLLDSEDAGGGELEVDYNVLPAVVLGPHAQFTLSPTLADSNASPNSVHLLLESSVPVDARDASCNEIADQLLQPHEDENDIDGLELDADPDNDDERDVLASKLVAARPDSAELATTLELPLRHLPTVSRPDPPSSHKGRQATVRRRDGMIHRFDAGDGEDDDADQLDVVPFEEISEDRYAEIRPGWKKRIERNLKNERQRAQYAGLAESIRRQFSTETSVSLLFVGSDDASRLTESVATLGIYMAERLQLNVLLVSGYAGSAGANRLAQVHDKTGLTDSLNGRVDWRERVLKTQFDRFSLLPLGRSPLSGNALHVGKLYQQIREMTTEYQYVLSISSAAELTSTMAQACDGTYLVIELGVTGCEEAQQTLESLWSNGGRVLGSIVLGDV